MKVHAPCLVVSLVHLCLFCLLAIFEVGRLKCTMHYGSTKAHYEDTSKRTNCVREIVTTLEPKPHSRQDESSTLWHSRISLQVALQETL